MIWKRNEALGPACPSIGSGAWPVLLREIKAAFTNARANSSRFQLLKFWADTIVPRVPEITDFHFF
jgi:hypothetical protein